MFSSFSANSLTFFPILLLSPTIPKSFANSASKSTGIGAFSVPDILSNILRLSSAVTSPPGGPPPELLGLVVAESTFSCEPPRPSVALSLFVGNKITNSSGVNTSLFFFFSMLKYS